MFAYPSLRTDSSKEERNFLMKLNRSSMWPPNPSQSGVRTKLPALVIIVASLHSWIDMEHHRLLIIVDRRCGRIIFVKCIFCECICVVINSLAVAFSLLFRDRARSGWPPSLYVCGYPVANKPKQPAWL